MSEPMEDDQSARNPSTTGDMSSSDSGETASTYSTTSIAILVCASGNDKLTSPVVVWACRKRARSSLADSWRHTLEYYEFSDDGRWTHLDALLTRLAPVAGIHVGSSENLSKAKSKASRLRRRVESLQSFIDTRDDLACPPEDGMEPTPVECRVRWHVPVDSARIDTVMQQLLLDELAYKANTGLVGNTRLMQGLSLWLHAEQLLGGKPANEEDLMGSCRLRQGLLDSHMALDRVAAESIHLLPPPNAGAATVVGGTHANNSLLGILSGPCLTRMGSNTIQSWLRQPLVSLPQIRARQDCVEALLGLGKDQIRASLKTFTGVDLQKLASVLRVHNEEDEDKTSINSSKSLEALYQLYLLASSKVPQLQEALDLGDDDDLPQILRAAKSSLVLIQEEFGKCHQLVEAVLDLDQAPREYLVRAEFQEELQELATNMEEVAKQVEEEHEHMQSLWAQAGGSGNQVKLERSSGIGDDATNSTGSTSTLWQFRLPNTNDSKALASLGSKIQVHRLLKNGAYFSTMELRQLSTKYHELLAEYQTQSKQVVRDAMNVAATYQPVVERTGDVVAHLDALCSLAHVAALSPHGYCKPTMTDSEEDGAGIELKAARHPCVELQQDMSFIPNDITLKFGESNFLLVTGPNMGGKSTYIRSLGAIVTMAQIGSYVPCDSATINICHAILARVGAGDLQDRGISTFMAEMLESSSILRVATKRSLIIVDELGRGTSTFDGYGLARSISEYMLKRIGCMVVFTTHYHELTLMEHEFPGVKNCHVSAMTENQGITFLYQIQPGPCLQSFGIQVAELANMPKSVIDDAKRRAARLETFSSNPAEMDVDDEDLERFLSADLSADMDDAALDSLMPKY